MNILYIFHYAGSPEYGMAYRPYYLAKEWIKQGHNVTIVAASYSHLRMIQPKVKKDFDEEIIDGIRYVWMKTPEYGGSIARIKNIASYVWKLLRYKKRICEMVKPDLVIASSTYPLDNIPAHKIARLSGAKHCYEAHDIWPLSPMVIGGYKKWHPFIVVMQYAENYACRKADKVISLLWNSEEHYKECGLKSGKFVCIPNGYSKGDWSKDAENAELPAEHAAAFEALKDKVVVGFAGGFAVSAALDTLVNAAELLKESDAIRIVMVGKGPEKEHLQQLIADKELSNVIMLPAVSKKLIPAVNAKFDIAYMGGVHSVLHKYGTSYNKMTDYMISGKPIIQAIDEPGCMTEKIGCGCQVEAENPKMVTEAILKIASMSEEERCKMGSKGRKYADENLEWGILAKKFMDTFKE